MLFIDKTFKIKQAVDNMKLIDSNMVGSDIIFLNEFNRSKNNEFVDYMKYQKIPLFNNIIVPKNMTLLNKRIINTKLIKKTRDTIPQVTTVMKKNKLQKNNNIFDISSLQEPLLARINTGAKTRVATDLFDTINKICLDYEKNPNTRGSILESKERKQYLFVYNNIDLKDSVSFESDILDFLEYYFKLKSYKLEDSKLEGLMYIVNKRYFPLTTKILDKDNKPVLIFNQTMVGKINNYIKSLGTKENTKDSIKLTLKEGREKLSSLVEKMKETTNTKGAPENQENQDDIEDPTLTKIKKVINSIEDENIIHLPFDKKVEYIFNNLNNKKDKDEITLKDIKEIKDINIKSNKKLKEYHGSQEIHIPHKGRIFNAQEIVGLNEISGLNRQKKELGENIDTKMIDLFKSIENDPDINLKILDVKIDLVDEYNNRYKNYKVKVKHKYGITFDKPYVLQIKVPYVIDDKYIKINGNNYIMINQIFPKPLHKVNQNLVRLYTHFNTASFSLASSSLKDREIVDIENNLINKISLLEKEGKIKTTIEKFDNDKRNELLELFNIPKLSFIKFVYSKINIINGNTEYLINFDYDTFKDDKLPIYTKTVIDELNNKKVVESSFIKDDSIITYKDGDVHNYSLNYLDQFIFDKLNNISNEVVKYDLYKKTKTSSPTFMMNLPGIKNKSIVLYLVFILGLDETLKKLKIKYSFLETKNKDAYLNIPFKNGYLQLFPETNMKKFMSNGFKIEKFKNTKFTNNFMEDYYKKDLGYRANKYKELSNKFIDESSKKALKEYNYPDNLIELISGTIPNMLLNRHVPDVLELDNYRLRMSETVSNVAYELFQRAVTSFKNKKDNANEKIDIDKNYIFSNLISASILQETISINPLEELMLSLKVTKGGVGNAKGNMINLQRRDLNPSYFGHVGPTATNEYGGIGVNQTLTNSFLLSDKEGGFSKKKFSNDSNPFENLSPVESLSPFFEYDDTTRRIMGNQQTGQFIQIDNPDEQLIQTGFESYIPYLVSNRFIKKAKKNGKITSIKNDIITILYDDKTTETIDTKDIKSRTKRGIYIPTKYTKLCNEGQKVKANDILASTSSLKTGKLAIGKNIVIGLVPYMGMNFEDGWAVTHNLDQKFKHSILKRILIPIPANATIEDINLVVGNSTDAGDTLISFQIDNTTNNIYDNSDEESDIFTGLVTKGKNNTYNSPGGVIKEIVVKINDMKTTPKEIKHLHKKTIAPVEEKIKSCKLTTLNKEEYLDCIGNLENVNSLKIGNHKFEGSEYDGSIVEVYIEVNNPIINGTKFTLANTGGKGTIQYQIPKGKEPKALETGLTIDFLPTSVGIIKRKNISILLMLYLGKVMYFLNETIKELARNPKNISIIKNTILEVYTCIDKTKGNIVLKQLKEMFAQNDNVLLNIINKSDSLQRPAFPAIVPPFGNKITIKDIENASKVLGIPLNEKINIPEIGMDTEEPIAVGILPIHMLEHFPKGMSSVRGSMYTKKEFVSGQGRSGTKDGSGANKIGTYDLFSLLTKSPYGLLKELHAIKSDAPKAKRKMMMKIIKAKPGEQPDLDDIELDEDKDHESKRYSEALFLGAGLEPNF